MSIGDMHHCRSQRLQGACPEHARQQQGLGDSPDGTPVSKSVKDPAFLCRTARGLWLSSMVIAVMCATEHLRE